MTTGGDGDGGPSTPPEPHTQQQKPVVTIPAAVDDSMAHSIKSSSSDDGRLSGTDDCSSGGEIDSGAKDIENTQTQQETEGGGGGGASSSRNDNTRSNMAKGKGVLWKEDLSNLLTPQTVLEQAQVRRRKRNREAARRSRQRQKEREQELVDRQAQLSDRLRFLERELEEWRTINASSTRPNNAVLIDPAELAASDSQDVELAENINKVYALTMDTLHLIGELQLQLDEITKELYEMIG
ncbi:hypothetical protein GGI11_002354 [Coemansia sp. RSA 2049]|nr:hypothetical protein GGI11_002354 [Coemansia sp. RSA 2049]KAJ2591806.1 hypothetical protein EV177_008833 [Coemansia sp. RSA 1804]KAJ2678004.1 hypothetical protein GGH99_005723 [Coemansia sp. RSA 1285]